MIPVINFAALQPQGNPLIKGLLPAIQQGLALGYQPKIQGQELQRQKLANALAQLQLQYEPRMQEAKIKQMESIANLPFGGQTLPGASGQILALESIKQMFGEDSQQYQNALKAFQLEQTSDQARIDYEQMLTKTGPTRMLTPTGKLIVEESNVTGGLTPSGQEPPKNLPLPAPADVLADQYKLERLKRNTDTQARSKNLYATNIEKTLGMINPSDLTQYSGTLGNLERIAQKGLSSVGKESSKYDDYMKSRQAVEFLTSQVRQFYGDSIQPAMIDRLQALADPSTWFNSPKLAKQLFNTTKDILGKEMQTYRDALKNPKVYEGNQAFAFNPSPEQENAMVKSGMATRANPKIIRTKKSSNGKVYKLYDNGEWHE